MKVKEIYLLRNKKQDAIKMMEFYDKSSKGYKIWKRIHDETQKKIKSLGVETHEH